MGEIDTKPIESVQAAISLFSEKHHYKKNRLTGNDECERDRELESVLKELANNKVQLEAKEGAYMQTLLKLEHTKEKVDELSILIENFDIERERYVNECKDTSTRIENFESEAKEMADQLLKAAKIREQLSRLLNELKAKQGELLCKETMLDSAREAELKALTQVEVTEKALDEEREKCQELLKQISELNEFSFMLKAAESEAQKEKITILSEKDKEIELAKIALSEAKERLEDMERDVEMMQEMENEFVFKTILGDVLELKLVETNEELILSKKFAADAVYESKLIREELELKGRKNLSQEALIEAFKMEMNQMKVELRSANELVSQLMDDVEILTYDLQKAKTVIDEMRRKETEAQVEIALLKSELHKEMPKIATAEAAEVQQLMVEAQKAKKENQSLKKEANEDYDMETGYFDESSQIGELYMKTKERSDRNDTHITVSLKEYESLIKKADDRICEPKTENKHELENVRKELDAALAKVAEFRNRGEQANFRAEMAEKAKAAIEDQLRKWREDRQKKNSSLVVVPTVASTSRDFVTSSIDENPRPTHYQPLFKLLNMKF